MTGRSHPRKVDPGDQAAVAVGVGDKQTHRLTLETAAEKTPCLFPVRLGDLRSIDPVEPHPPGGGEFNSVPVDDLLNPILEEIIPGKQPSGEKQERDEETEGAPEPGDPLSAQGPVTSGV